MNDPLCCPPVMPPNIGRDNVVVREGERVLAKWREMTPAERNEIVMASVNRCPVARKV